MVRPSNYRHNTVILRVLHYRHMTTAIPIDESLDNDQHGRLPSTRTLCPFSDCSDETVMAAMGHHYKS